MSAASTSTVSRCQRRNKKVVSARALLYTELGYIDSLTEKSTAALHQVCLSDGITIDDILAGNYRGRGVSRAAVEAARSELDSDRHIKGDPNLRNWSTDARHAVFLHKNGAQAVHQDGDKVVDDTEDEVRQGCEDAEHELEECSADRTARGGGDVADITQREREDSTAARGEREDENMECAAGGERKENRECAAGGEREDNTECAAGGEREDNTECAAGGEREDNMKCAAGGEREDNTECAAGGEREDNTECAAGGEREDNTECAAGGEREDNTECAASGEREEENRECATGGEREDNTECAAGGEREEENRECVEGRAKEERPAPVPRARRGRLMDFRRCITGIGRRMRKLLQCCNCLNPDTED
ncbi:spore wall protein 2-like [Branchiostoma floridae]|uniref:Spore wall protein 2-like n=1 Tax=Branchiostoma floridae TaxID=7739 RepID=A0A9J7MKI4_BRAFL|nr:spore wall protein 2-like [Branchiostoma floridae]